jgi:hypothetical protein
VQFNKIDKLIALDKQTGTTMPVEKEKALNIATS